MNDQILNANSKTCNADSQSLNTNGKYCNINGKDWNMRELYFFSYNNTKLNILNALSTLCTFLLYIIILGPYP